MKQSNYIKYFRVFKNDTAVTEVSTNDFKPFQSKRPKTEPTAGKSKNAVDPVPGCIYSLPPDQEMFYGYLTRFEALERAKAGAIAYIDVMIKDEEKDIQKLKQYRMDHFEDLNINLLEENIRSLETKMNS